jgi:hypothetical protein
MSFVQWLIADALDGVSDAALALCAGGIAWTITDALRSLL